MNKNEVYCTQVLAGLSNYRGMHSTGVVIGKGTTSKRMKKRNKKGHQYVWTKQVGASLPLVFTDPITKHLQHNQQPFLFAVHTRHATLGKINQENAHPFQVGHILGMHNGTAPTFKPSPGDTRTDSELIYTHMEKHGVEATIKKMDFKDAYCLIWVDQESDCINFIRNSDRPLHFAFNENGTTVFWASERIMLMFALAKAGLSKDFEIQELKTHTLTSINLMDPRDTIQEHLSPWPKTPSYVKPKEEVKKEKVDTFREPILPVDNRVIHLGDHTNRTRSKYEPGVKSLMRYYPYDENGVPAYQVMVEKYDAHMIPLIKFKDMMNKGCTTCDHVPDSSAVIARQEELHWYAKDQYMCTPCKEVYGSAFSIHTFPQPRDRPDLEQDKAN